MKQLSLLIFLLSQTFIFAQSQNLAELAKGEHIGFNAIFDQKDNLYGYVSQYSYGKSGDKTKKFEYVILDKNLNPIANKEFEGDITAKSYYAYMDFRGKIILRPRQVDNLALKNKDFFIPRSMEISPEENSVRYKTYYDYEDGKFTEVAEPSTLKSDQKEVRTERREKGYNYVSAVSEVKEGGFLAIEYHDYGTYVNNNKIIKYDSEKKELWRYQYNTSGDRKINEEVSILEKDENYLYLLFQKNEKKLKRFQLLVLDMKTGKELHRKDITGLADETMNQITNMGSYSFGRIDNSKTFEDKIVFLGRTYENSYTTTGFSRLMIDRKTFEVDTKVITYQSLKHLVVNLQDDGKVEKGYFLDPRDAYFMKDGSIGILMEKYKPEGEYSAPKTTDLVYIFTDKDFNLSGVKVFEKEKTKWANSDYLFSQYLNEGEDVVFFYRDYQKDETTKEKNWNLYINTLIEGQFKQEIVPISAKDDYSVFPYVGKEGYILLRELNEKEKFNKIRLERLNY